MKKIREQEAKEEIAKRLQRSNKKLWDEMTEEERVGVSTLYYESRGLKYLGIEKILDYNTSLYQNSGFLLLGLILGVFGNLIANILQKAFDEIPLGLSAISILVLFLLVLWGFMHFVESAAAENLADDQVLEYFLEKIRKDKTINLD